MIKNSLEWSPVESELIHKSLGLVHGKEIRKMIRNIQLEVKQLSKAEVDARRGKKLRAQDLLVKINDDIELVEGYLLVAALIG